VAKSTISFFGWFGRLFLIFQGLEIVFDVPIGLLGKLPSFILQVSAFDLLVNWSVLATIVSISAAMVAFVIAVPSWALIRTGFIGEIRCRKAIILVGIFVFLAASIYDIWVIGFPDFHPNIRGGLSISVILITILLTLVAYRYANFERVYGRLVRCGSVFSIVVIALFIVAVISGVRLGASDRINSGMAPPVVATSERPNIIYVISDALSANAMSLYGERMLTTPNLQNLARMGVTIDGMTAVDNWTVPTVATLYSGVGPARHGLFSEVSHFIDDKNFSTSAMLPAQLRQAGYATYSVMQNGLAAPFHMHIQDQFDETRITSEACGALTFFCLRIRGADVPNSAPMFGLFYHAARLANAIYHGKATVFSPTEDAYNAALDVLDNRVKKDRPFLLWVHLFAPHDPYLTPPPHRRKFDKSNALLKWSDFHAVRNNYHLPLRYRESISYADASFAKFYSALESRKLLENSIVVFSSDHGETFDRWMYHAGPRLNEDLIRLPFVIWGPSIPMGKVVKERVSQIDIAPTLLDIAGVKRPSQMEGESLLPLIHGKSFTPRPVFSASLSRNGRFKNYTKGTFAMLEGPWKYIQYLEPDSEEIFNLSDDPREKENLAAMHPDILKRMRQALNVHFAPRKPPYKGGVN
jgi:arylsulfatase A-like enzyme